MSDDVGPVDPVPWLDQNEPLEADRSAAQIRGLLERLSAGDRVLDLGCGAGRTVEPLAAAGVEVVGLDRDAAALARCRDRLADGSSVVLHEADFLTWTPDAGDPGFDAVLCLGNTLMTVHDVNEASDLVRRAASFLRGDGMVIIDDLAGDFWPELAEGNWQAGLAPDGDMQLIWAPDDAVFTIRMGDDVDVERWTLQDSDVRYRLWSRGALLLLATVAGLSVPEIEADAGLLVMRRLGESDAG